MYSSKWHTYSKIIIALVMALIGADFLTQSVFVASSPRVRPDLADVLVERTLALINVDTYLAFFRDDADENKIDRLRNSVANLPKTQIVPGVYAAESEYGTVTDIIESEIQYSQHQYQQKDGTVVVIEVPAGMEPPPPGLF